VPWSDPGSFYTGDSYVVLSAVYAGTTKRVVRDIFFWIGTESSQDEYGTAAIKTIELDARFGGDATQHREVQYHESEAFHKIFAPYGGVRYLDGGVASGFKAVDTLKGVSLYQVKGRRYPVLLKVPAVGTSLNHGDAFILTSDTTLYLWFGKGANIQEKNKANRTLDLFSIRFKGATKVRLENSDTTPEFWALLGGETPIADADAVLADAEVEKANVTKIYSVDGAGYTLIAQGVAATLDKLKNPAGLLIIERGESIVVYLPKNSPQVVKDQAINVGVAFLQAQRLPSYYSVSVAKEGVRSDEIELIFT
jgi:hypothetical protein